MSLAKKITLQYCIEQCGYWGAACALYGFATTFLLQRGFQISQAGILLAMGNIIGVVLQPVLAGVADSGRISVHRLLQCLLGIVILLMAALLAVPGSLHLTALLFVGADAGLWGAKLLSNSLCIYYINRGIAIDFGMPRSAGSVCYALSAAILGRLIGVLGENVIMLCGIAFLALAFLIATVMPVYPEQSDAAGAGPGELRQENEEAAEMGSENKFDLRDTILFLREYKNFALIMAGIVLLYIFHNMLGNYLIQIVRSLGGDAAEQGIAITIAAVVEFPTMFLFSWIHKRVKTGTLLLTAAAAYVARAVFCLCLGSIGQLYLAQTLQMFTFALLVPTSVYFVNETMEKKDAYKGQAVMSATETLGGVLGSLLGGFLIDFAGLEAMLLAGAGMTAAGTAIVYGCLRGKRAER